MNIALLGLGSIANRIIQGIKEAEDATLYAVASRDIQRSLIVQKESDALHAFGSYEEAYKDINVDILYIATANPYHYEMIREGLLHHKHVICEKPMVESIKQLEELFALAKEQGVFLMEAEKTLFTPLNQRIKEMIMQGVIGDVVAIDATYAQPTLYETESFEHWVFQDGFGGCTFDIGVYPICYCNYFANSTVKTITTEKRYEQLATDVHVQGMLTYANQVQATFCASWIMMSENEGTIYGTKGYIKTKNFWKNNCSELFLADGTIEKIEVPKTSDFKGEIEHAIKCIKSNLCESPILGLEETRAILRIVLN